MFGNLDQCVAQLRLTDGQYQFTALEELPIGVVDDFLIKARIQLDDGGKLFTVPHLFILLDRREHLFSDGYPFDHPEQVELPHYLVEYMSSSLRWIPTWNYSTTPTPQTGLNLYGTTEIRLKWCRNLQRCYWGLVTNLQTRSNAVHSPSTWLRHSVGWWWHWRRCTPWRTRLSRIAETRQNHGDELTRSIFEPAPKTNSKTRWPITSSSIADFEWATDVNCLVKQFTIRNIWAMLRRATTRWTQARRKSLHLIWLQHQSMLAITHVRVARWLA